MSSSSSGGRWETLISPPHTSFLSLWLLLPLLKSLHIPARPSLSLPRMCKPYTACILHHRPASHHLFGAVWALFTNKGALAKAWRTSQLSWDKQFMWQSENRDNRLGTRLGHKTPLGAHWNKRMHSPRLQKQPLPLQPTFYSSSVEQRDCLYWILSFSFLDFA